MEKAQEVVPDVMKPPSRYSLHEERMDVRSHGPTLTLWPPKNIIRSRDEHVCSKSGEIPPRLHDASRPRELGEKNNPEGSHFD